MLRGLPRAAANFIGDQPANPTQSAILLLINSPTAKPLSNYSEPTEIAVREQALAHALASAYELTDGRRGQPVHCWEDAPATGQGGHKSQVSPPPPIFWIVVDPERTITQR